MTYTALLLVMAITFSSCKNQKKLSELSDSHEEVQEQEEESAEETTEENSEEESGDNSTSSEETRNVIKEPTREAKLNNFFSAIAGASTTTTANNSIREALSMFSSPNAPVLIVIYKDGGKPSYDEPTTIEKYLNYLKDTQNNKARVEEVVYDEAGKIKELVLRK